MSDFVGRIDQLDAIELDSELKNVFIKQLREVLFTKKFGKLTITLILQAVKYFPQWLLVKILPEIETILELSLYLLTFYLQKSTTGQNLLGLKVKVTLVNSILF